MVTGLADFELPTGTSLSSSPVRADHEVEGADEDEM